MFKKSVLNLIVVLLLNPLGSIRLMAESPVCESRLSLCEQEITIDNKLIDAQDQYVKRLKEQRQEAVEELSKQSGSPTPFYIWVILGVAGGVILTRGIR